MNASKAQQILGVNEDTLAQLLRDGKIRIKKQGAGYYFDDTSVWLYYREINNMTGPKRMIEAGDPNAISSYKHIEKYIDTEWTELIYHLYTIGYKLPEKYIDHLRSEKIIEMQVGDMSKEAESQEQAYFEAQKKKIKKQRIDEREKYKSYPDVSSAEWKPRVEEEANYPREFVDWINAINEDFRNIDKKPYKRFEAYVRQAKVWLAKTHDITDFKTESERYKYAVEEDRRICENTLYFANRYAYYKDSKAIEGKSKYYSDRAQEVIFFILDSNFPFIAAKGRQIWFTTSMSIYAVKKVNFMKNHFTKFIAENEAKGVEIFTDKIIWAFQALDGWLKRHVINKRDRLFAVGKNGGKADDAGSSKIMVEPPYATAVNGGSPDEVFVDESGQIKILPDMINEGLPAMYGYDPDVGRQRLLRRIASWGTGGQMDRGGKAFEIVYRSQLKKWHDGDYSGLIPLFFNAFARPGISQEFIDKQQTSYYEMSRIGKTRKYIVQFHQHYPMNIDDVFMSEADTIIDIQEIVQRIKACRDLPAEYKPVYGFFEAIFDYTRKMPENSLVPYAPVGAQFVETTEYDLRATTQMLLKPAHLMENGEIWIDRYYQGTDPIFSQSGLSMFSSTIWDDLLYAPVCIVNFREQEYRNCYLQAFLMKLYYSNPQHRVKELLEINVGREYANLMDQYGWYDTLIPNKALPRQYHVQTNEPIGVQKRSGKTSEYLISNLTELVHIYGENIFFEVFWNQVKSFNKEIQPSGKEVYKPKNPKFDRDDVLDSANFAYLAALAHRLMGVVPHMYGAKKDSGTGLRQTKRVLVCNRETGWKNVWKNVAA